MSRFTCHEAFITFTQRFPCLSGGCLSHG
jgi:hypothetical protein